MELKEIMEELKSLGTERTKKIYMSNGAQAKKIAQEVGKVDVFKGKNLCQTNVATESIQNAVDKGNLGFKRKNVRC